MWLIFTKYPEFFLHHPVMNLIETVPIIVLGIIKRDFSQIFETKILNIFNHFLHSGQGAGLSDFQASNHKNSNIES